MRYRRIVPPTVAGVLKSANVFLGNYEVVLSVSSAAELTASSASRNCVGNSRPRFAARRKMPRQAVGLKKYFGGTVRASSKTSDNEHTPPPLWHSVELSVENPVGPPIPEFAQPGKDDGKVPPSIGGKQARDILDKYVLGKKLADDSPELVPEAAPLAVKASTLSSHGKVLAGESSDDGVGSLADARSNKSNIIHPLDRRPVFAEDRSRLLVLLRLQDALPPGPLESEVDAAASRE